MKLSFLYATHHGPDSQCSDTFSSSSQSQGNDGRDVDVRLHPAGGRQGSGSADPAIGVHVPHLVDVEVVQALRRLATLGELTAVEAQTTIDDLRSLDLQRLGPRSGSS